MRFTSAAVCATVLLILIAVGCEQKPVANSSSKGQGRPAKASSLSGTIDIQGSSTVEPISVKAKERFNVNNPNVNISVSGQGTSNGFEALVKKECDVCDASRPIKKEEVERCKAAGSNFIEIPVAYDGLTVVVNKENTWVTQLTIDQLITIFREDKAAKTWKEVDSSWPDEKIAIYIPGINSGTHDYFVEVIGKKDNKKIRIDEQTTPSEDDKQLVFGVKGDKNAIGFFGYAYYETSKDALKAVAIVDPATNKAVMPSPATIESHEYSPLSRPLFWYVNAESINRAEVREWLDDSMAGISDIVTAAGYVPLPKALYAIGQAHIEKGLTGSHFYDADGKQRKGSLTEIYTEANAGK
jgi:phosphate transport system substrate-binding protein